MKKYTDLLKHDILKRYEEHQLLTEAQSGNEMSRERLILLNLRLVNKIARGYARPNEGVSAQDLIADGVQGLIRAIDGFDVETGYRFSTYAHLAIHWAIGRSELLNEMIRLPVYVRERQWKIRKAEKDLVASGIHAPTFEEISKASGVSLKHVELHALLHQTVIGVASLDAPVGEDGDMTLADVLPTQETDIDLVGIKADLDWFLSLLPDMERFILTRAYGIPVEMTFAELAARFGRSEQWVRQVHDRALASLQRLGRALTGSVGQAFEAVNNPHRIMNLCPAIVPEGISFVDDEVVEKEPVTQAVQLYFAL